MPPSLQMRVVLGGTGVLNSSLFISALTSSVPVEAPVAPAATGASGGSGGGGGSGGNGIALGRMSVGSATGSAAGGGGRSEGITLTIGSLRKDP